MTTDWLVTLLVLGSAPLAGEVPGRWEVVGVGVVSAGVLSVALERGLPWRHDLRPPAFALGTGVLIATYTVVDGLGVRRAGSPLGYSAWLFLLDGVPWAALLLCLRWRQPTRVTPRRIGQGFAAGALSMAAYSLVLWALSLGLLAPIAALRETSVIIAALIGTLLLGEPFGRRCVAAACLVAAGVVLLIPNCNQKATCLCGGAVAPPRPRSGTFGWRCQPKTR
jgi:drug/metabolite transporter (DMT)-like permease